MTSDRSLSPSDAVVAIRSFPRRFRGVLSRPDDDRFDPDEVSRRIGPQGHSAVDHLVAADRILALLGEAVEQARAEDEPVLHPAFGDLAAASVADSTGSDDQTAVADLLDRFEGDAAHAADRVDGVPTDDWNRTVQVAGGAPSTNLLAVVQDAVAAIAEHLRAAERTVDAVV